MFGRVLLYNRWGFLSVPYELGRYYRRLFLGQYGLKLQRPSNEEHITIISPWDNVDLSDRHGWNDWILKFEVKNELFYNGNAVWLDVISEEILNFRNKEFDLGAPEIGLHFCIGYLGENEND